jgi:hypothetical protein
LSTAMKDRTTSWTKEEWAGYLGRLFDLKHRIWGLCQAISHIPGRRLKTADLACEAQNLVQTSILPLERHIYEDLEPPTVTFDFIYQHGRHRPNYSPESHLPGTWKRNGHPLSLAAWEIEGWRIQALRNSLFDIAHDAIEGLGKARTKRHCAYLRRVDQRLARIQRDLASLIRKQYPDPAIAADDIIAPTSCPPITFLESGAIDLPRTREHSMKTRPSLQEYAS